ncbi:MULTISPECIES: hypothetical protein [unclassified Mesorhizobium]|uniref:hypothetical protein n=1 Tax=unclassified Mesorhizobium TaxID=325217 RepID=UPI000FDA5C87|nr:MULTISPECIES: hypothetical protein [unclassified Mesorhizobium]TGQ17833.1 hypothetical protein EN862_010405 [Mesorhizobium sp. M2E.F.Ca.ET.219.01.1.1]TGT64262.1 hypothetical protein EN809_034725 [Mesorhizobium sp. M2E.F.Ca.ET.166.01.1.1]TGV97210.1 hypothetical protein EN797_034735 [Mesorhizobium sp. M2E.F.Ca.ET.154.01.1.1]
MSDGPTVVNSGGGGAAVAIVLAILAIVGLLFFTGVINVNGNGGTKEVSVSVNAPKVEAPSVAKPAAPAPKSATGG